MHAIPQETRTHLLFDIELALYSGADKELKTELIDIIHRNSILHSNNQPYFMYAHKIYRQATIKAKMGKNINYLHASLINDFQEYERKIKIIIREKTIVLGYVRAIFSLTSATEDIKELLPSALHNIVSKYSSFFHGKEQRVAEGELLAFREERDDLFQAMQHRMLYNLILPQ